jgi:hypothetical protein
VGALRLKITLPESLKDLPEAYKVRVVDEISKALGSTPMKDMQDEKSIWTRNDEELLGEAEDDFYEELVGPSMDNMASLIAALGLTEEEVEFKKSFGEDYFEYEDTLIKAKDSGQHKMSDLIKLANSKRKDFLKYIQGGSNWAKSKLKEIDKILKQALPDYQKLAEKLSVRAAFIAKIRNKADAEALDTLGAYVDKFPETVTEAKHEGIVLNMRQKKAAEEAGLKVKILQLQPQEVRTVENGALRTAEKLTEISDRHRAKVKQMVLQAINGRWSAQQLAQALFDAFGEENRDWRRVAITELAMASNDGFLAGCEEGDQVWVPPVAGACKHCIKYLEGKTFTVTHDPAKMGNTYSQEMQNVWVGKSNFGRTTATYIPCIPLHPNCRHRYHKLSRFYKVVDGKPVLKTSAELIQEERAKRGLPPDENLK